MLSTNATSESLFRSYLSLPSKHKRDFISKLLTDEQFNEDLTDIALINQRLSEPSVSLEEYLKKRNSKKK